MLNSKTIWFICVTCCISLFIAEDLNHDPNKDIDDAYPENPHKVNEDEDFDMENAIQNIESLAVIADQMFKINVMSSTDTESFYSYMIDAIEKVSRAIRRFDNIDIFIKSNGPVRILSANLMNPHVKLRTKLLKLLKDIFDIAPSTAGSLLPLNIVDVLVDIFANDNNLALKAHALDILYKWLPNNPQVQVRIMKIASLETFYEQVDKLDVGVIQTLMELFNLILEEHVNVRNDKTAIAKDDGETLILYQRIGLLERLSTPKVCNGLLHIFEMLWSYNRNESDNVKTVLELLKNVLPFCGKFYKKKSKAMDLFEQLSKYVKDENKKKYFEKLRVDVVDAGDLLDRFLGKKNDSNLLTAKDEF